MPMSPDIRWQQRFQNFDRAYVLLRQALERGPAVLSPLEKEGVIQRFEYSFDFSVFEKAVDAIAARYLPAMEELHHYFVAKGL
jgi:hypothetical protein